jgi:hypothetical protein
MRIEFAGQKQKGPCTSDTSVNPLPSELNLDWVGRVFGATWCGSRGPCTSAAVG